MSTSARDVISGNNNGVKITGSRANPGQGWFIGTLMNGISLLIALHDREASEVV